MERLFGVSPVPLVAQDRRRAVLAVCRDPQRRGDLLANRGAVAVIGAADTEILFQLGNYLAQWVFRVGPGHLRDLAIAFCIGDGVNRHLAIRSRWAHVANQVPVSLASRERTRATSRTGSLQSASRDHGRALLVHGLFDEVANGDRALALE